MQLKFRTLFSVLIRVIDGAMTEEVERYLLDLVAPGSNPGRHGCVMCVFVLVSNAESDAPGAHLD